MSATIVWSTDQPIVTSLDYGPTMNFRSTFIESSPDMTQQAVLTGLSPATTYQYRVAVAPPPRGTVDARTGSFTTEPQPAIWEPGPSGPGIWVGRDELTQRPAAGPAWDDLLADAARDPGPADLADQDSNHDVYTLAAALVCARVGQYCAKARKGVLDAMGTETGARWLAIGRNLGAYVIAADLLDLRADGTADSEGTRVEQWIASWLTKRLSDNNDLSTLRGIEPFHSGANAAAQEGFVHAAVAAYLGDPQALERSWNAFRTFVCDPGVPDTEGIYLVPPVLDGWAHDNLSPCAVNPAGALKLVPLRLLGGGLLQSIDGAIIADMRRGGEYQWPPGYTSYPWVGLEGLVPAAVILHRAGYRAFDVAERAVLRAHEYLWYLRNETGDTRWFDGGRAREIVHLVNVVYGVSFPVSRPTGAGRTVGYTDWTHASW